MRKLLLAGASAAALAGCALQPPASNDGWPFYGRSSVTTQPPIFYSPPQYRPPVATAPDNAPDDGEPVIPAPRRHPQQSSDAGAGAQAPPRPSPSPRPAPPSGEQPECVGWWRICHFFF
jgi:hypothetical protein